MSAPQPNSRGAQMKAEIESRRRAGSFLDAHRESLKGPDLSSPHHREASRIARVIVPILLESSVRASRVDFRFNREKMDIIQDAVRYHLNAAMIKEGVDPKKRDEFNAILSPAIHAMDLLDPKNEKMARLVISIFLLGLDNLGQLLAFTEGDIIETGKDGTKSSIVEDIFGPAVLGRFPKKKVGNAPV
jgi:hypothetical protein